MSQLNSSKQRSVRRSVCCALSRLFLVWVGLTTLGGCATKQSGNLTNTQATSAAAATVVEGPSQEPANGAVDDPKLPKVDLTQELLEQLLIVGFAPYSGDFQTSAEHAMAAAKLSQDYRLASYAAVTALRTQNFALARQGAELWLTLVDDDKAARTTLIIALLGLNEIDAAYQQLNQARGDQPLANHIEDSAALLVRQRNGDAAVKVAGKYVADHPNAPQVLLSAAYIADSFAKHEQAQAWLEEALVMRPEWDEAAQMKATNLRRQGKTEERAAYIRDYLARHPESVSMRINHAAELARAENYAQALVVMQAVVADDPENVPALNYTAALAEQQQDEQLAKKLYRKILRLEPNNDEVYWSLARFAVREKKYQRAEDYYQEISGERLYFRAQLQVANMRYHTRGLKDAINTLRGLEPSTEQEYIDRATTRHYLLMQEHQHEEAFAAINETLAFLPENIELRYARALVAAEISEIQTAEDDLRFVIAQQPDNADALNALGYTLADQTERYEEAKELIAKALELRPDEAHILDSMGWILYRLNDLDGAVEYLQQAYDRAPQAEIAAHLGEVLWEQGKQDKARVVWSEGLAEDQDNPVLNATMQRYGVDVKAKSDEQLSLAN